MKLFYSYFIIFINYFFYLVGWLFFSLLTKRINIFIRRCPRAFDSRLTQFSQGNLCIWGYILGEKIFVFNKWVCARHFPLQIFFQIEKAKLSSNHFLNWKRETFKSFLNQENEDFSIALILPVIIRGS